MVNARGRYPAVDGLRAIAVASVVAFHLNYLSAGFLGVNIFFTISGFVITLTLLREWRDTRTIARLAFYKRRWFRLYPALIVVVVAAIAVFAVTDQLSAYPGAALAAGVYLFNIADIAFRPATAPLSHTWSLAVEEQFYLIWAPVLLFMLRRLQLAHMVIWSIFGVICAVILGGVLTRKHALDVSDLYHLPTTYVDQLLIGAILAMLIDEPRVRRVASSIFVGVGATVVIGIAMLAGPKLGDQRWFYGGYFALAVAVAALIGHVVSAQSPIATALGSRPMAWVGDRSYGIYLYHYPVVVLVTNETDSRLAQTFVTVVATAGIAAGSFGWVEQPIRNKWSHAPHRARATTPAQNLA